MVNWKVFCNVVAVALVTLYGSGCATTPRGVSVAVDTCCDAPFERYATYNLEMTNVPGFLEAYLRGGLSIVLEQKGLRPTVDDADLDVKLIFNQIFLSPASEATDTFAESVDPEIATRFAAAVNVDVIDTSSEHLVWSGRLSRIHNDPHGQPRGNDHKMQGIIDGFAELFAEYPIRLQDSAEM